MGEVGAFDAVYCSHMLEHLYPHEVVKALREFRRVLAASKGYAIIFVPDLEGVTISDGILYQSPSGPVRAIDMFYGGLGLIQGHPYMAHHIGFTSETLEAVILTAGFAKATMNRLRDSYNLMAVAQV